MCLASSVISPQPFSISFSVFWKSHFIKQRSTYVFHSNYYDSSLQQLRRHTLIPGHLVFLYPPDTVFPSVSFPSMSRSLPVWRCMRTHSHIYGMHIGKLYICYPQKFSSVHPCLSHSPSISHTLSCNSIVIGYIGLAIHPSAAAQFTYIRRPSGFSPDNQQHSLQYSHTHTHSHIYLCKFTHVKKSNFFLTMVAKRWNNQQTAIAFAQNSAVLL